MPEVAYAYDDPTTDASAAFEGTCDTNFTKGRLVAVTDRAQRSLTCYDGRGRTVAVAKRLANPSGALTERW